MAREKHSDATYKEENSSTENFDNFIREEVTAGILALYSQYIKMQRMKEYLVDGAILRCSKSTLKPFKVPGETEIKLKDVAGETKEEQEKRERTRLYVRKEDGKMTDVESLFATIYDCKKGELSALREEEEKKSEGPNLYPFRCNCEVEIDRDAEKEMIEKHRPECEVNGVCQYLMDLNDTWENWLSDEGEFYEERELKDGDGSVIAAECITMTSMLFCKHGGLITPADPGRLGRIVEEVFFTREELVSCGWSTITAAEVNQFNLALLDFGVTTRFSACMLLATMLAESENCLYTIEGEYQTKYDLDTPEGWQAFQISKGVKYDYNYTERGAGYIQITFASMHAEFLGAMNDIFQEENTAKYIAKKYPIEASVWYWTSFHKTRVGSLNDLVDMKYSEDSKKQDDLFLAVQYYVNGYQGTKEYIQNIEDGSYEIQEGRRVNINGVLQSFNVPNDWAKRVKCWDTVRRLL